MTDRETEERQARSTVALFFLAYYTLVHWLWEANYTLFEVLCRSLIATLLSFLAMRLCALLLALVIDRIFLVMDKRYIAKEEKDPLL